jgi:lipid A 3-O-deacylase
MGHGIILSMTRTRGRVGKFPFGRQPTGRLGRLLALLLLTLAVAKPVAAGDDRTSAAAGPPAVQSRSAAPAIGAYEVGLQTAYSFGITNNAQMVTFFPRVGRVIAVVDGRAPGVVTFGIEGMFSRIFETSDAMELGGGLLLRYRLAFPQVQPYAELEGGMLYSDLRRFDLGSRVLFSAQGAVGLQLPLWRGLAATGGYRFRHISNAGQSRINPGLNSNLLVAGLAYAF